MQDRYNDGRHKTLFCLAADLLALDSLCSALHCAEHEPRLQKTDKREKASFMTNLLLEAAARQGVELKLHLSLIHIYAEMAHKGAIFCALQLYLDFVNIFLYLLRLLGRRSSN